MKIDLHIIQNFPPHCLNRDDANTPKDCVFGGFRRARISSQCTKRAMRMYVKSNGLLPEASLATRSKLLVNEAVTKLVAAGRDVELAQKVVENALKGIGLGVDEGKTQYLLYVSNDAIVEFASKCDTNWDALASLDLGGDKPAEGTAEKSGKQKKKDAKAALSKELKDDLSKILNGKHAVDLALFGRMLADLPDKNIDAACQVAHAISTNEVRMEMDFFTAVDDLNTSAETGAGMMGVIDFNSACFYRYVTIDTDKLAVNLGGDKVLTANGVKAFVEAAVHAIPTGKQNSMAAHNPPSYVRAIVRDGGAPWNLANAFVAPVRPGAGADDNLVSKSISKLEDHLEELEGMYGTNGKKLEITLRPQGGVSFSQLITGIVEAIG